MSIVDLIRSPNLSADFLVDAVAERLRVNIDGTTITRNGTGQLQATTPGTLTPIYEWRDIWGEESAGIAANQDEYSYGNGATGRIGLPFDAGWEIQDVYLQADVAGTSATIGIMNYVNSGLVQLGTFTATSADYFETLAAPVAIPAGAVLGSRTLTVAGTWSDVRVGYRCRRLIGSVYVV